MKKKYICNEICNNCTVMENRQLAFLLNFLVEKYGEELQQDVNNFCPNLTCCPDCRIDDFCHITGCEIAKCVDEVIKKNDR